jgi:hypothetical protein
MKPSFSTIGNDEGGREHRAVHRPDAHQRLAKGDVARLRVDHGLLDDADAAVVQRGHDLVGEPAVGHAALDLAPVRREQDDLRGRRGLGVRQSLLAVRHGVGRRLAEARQQHATEADGGVDDALGRRERRRLHARHETLRRNGKLILAAAQQDDGELVAGEPRHGVAAPHDRAQAPCHGGDGLVRDIEAVGLVDGGEPLDADHDEGERSVGAPRPREFVRQHLRQLRARHRAGQPVLMGIGRRRAGGGDAGQHPHDAVHLGGAAVCAGEPAAGILHADRRPAGRRDDVSGLEGDAVTDVAILRAHHRIVARDAVVGANEASEGAAGRDGLDTAGPQHGRGLPAPGNPVGGDVPIIDGLADRSEDGPQIVRERLVLVARDSARSGARFVLRGHRALSVATQRPADPAGSFWHRHAFSIVSKRCNLHG